MAKTLDGYPEIMTIEEVAGYLRVTTTTLYTLARTGAIPAFRVGRCWRVNRNMLNDWLATRAYEPLDDEENGG